MADERDPQRDIARYLQLQGRAPQSHFDWETWRKIGQPGTYQAPPGVSSRFQGTSAGVGAPNYDRGDTHYNMFSGLNKTIEDTVYGVGKWAAGKFKRTDDDGGGSGKINASSSSSGSGSVMADGMDGDGAPMTGGTNRSQNASITGPSTSRGMRRSRRGDFGGTLSSMGITMVQGNDNYGTVFGNMGGANVGSGDYDNSFQSKNTGGRQTAFSGNIFGGGTPPTGGGYPPPTPTPPPPPTPTPPPPPTPTPPPPPTPTPPPNGPTPPPNGPTPPQPTGITMTDPDRLTPPRLTPSTTSTYGNTEGVEGAQETTQGPQRPPTTLPTQYQAPGREYNEPPVGGTPPMLAGYENMQEPQAPSQPTTPFKAQTDYMGIPTGKNGVWSRGYGVKYRGDQSQALPQFARMATGSFITGSPTAVQKSQGPKPTAGPKSVSSKKTTPKEKPKGKGTK